MKPTEQQKQILDAFADHGLVDVIRAHVKETIFSDLVSADPVLRENAAAVWKAMSAIEQIIDSVRTDYYYDE